MKESDITDPFVKKPTLTADGRAWIQRCYCCKEGINLLKDPSANKWLRIGPYVRHRKCVPPSL